MSTSNLRERAAGQAPGFNAFAYAPSAANEFLRMWMLFADYWPGVWMNLATRTAKRSLTALREPRSEGHADFRVGALVMVIAMQSEHYGKMGLIFSVGEGASAIRLLDESVEPLLFAHSYLQSMRPAKSSLPVCSKSIAR
jgi:hypothetical protein